MRDSDSFFVLGYPSNRGELCARMRRTMGRAELKCVRTVCCYISVLLYSILCTVLCQAEFQLGVISCVIRAGQYGWIGS